MAQRFVLVPVGSGDPIKQAEVLTVAVANRVHDGFKLQVNVEDDQWVSFYISDQEPESLKNPHLPDCTVFVLSDGSLSEFAALCGRVDVSVG